MTAPKPTRASYGDLVEVAQGGEVTRPDGSTSTVSGGLYVLDAAGTFDVAGKEYEVK